MSAQGKKSNSLLAAVNRAVTREEVEKPAATEIKPMEMPSSDAVLRRERQETNRRPSRAGTKLIGGHFDPKIARQLRMIAAEEDATIQALLEEAIDLLLIKRGKARAKDLLNK